ncbi:MAG: hypothetical protein A2Z21_02930 [Candidatus Fraserbacteria bacterium RBG_16_55_9]|uniref:4Fe-4S ferredoxin-type domain-containing protein n=1 Tax=Fraserbacteria sp. (strain RBG_16_55_9) TaxID=1817864 RepID=A0A1F5UYM1_FRAXR|nr:MAG: hypothetical protein A2Z21_02930 [Candidatus Fraserbacteria bacterium RBG_16_55_9]
MKTGNPRHAFHRRGFLKRAAAALGSSFFSPHSGSVLAQDFPGREDRLGMLVDLTRCIGCRRCEAACNQTSSLPAPEIPFGDKSVFEEKRRTNAKTYTVVNRYPNPQRVGMPVYVKTQCMHCDEPACVSACLVGALKKTPEGPVIYNADVCIGCRYCIISCPFYIPAYEYSNAFEPKVQKCFMCHDTRILKGEVPACATECPVEALTFGKRRDLLVLARSRIMENPDRYVDHIYGEREVGGTSWLYISGVPFEQLGFPGNLGTTPYPMLTREFLSFVPLVLVVWPALLGGFYLMTKRRMQEDRAESGEPKKPEQTLEA